MSVRNLIEKAERSGIIADRAKSFTMATPLTCT